MTERFRKLQSRASPDRSQLWLNWVVRLQTGELAGYVQATVVPGGSAHIAYEFASRFWRRGIGSTAVAAVLEELSANYGALDFLATFKARNFRSRALLERLAFTVADHGRIAACTPEPGELVMHKPAGKRENAA